MSGRHVKRRDANHAEIVTAFQQCGYSVLDLSQVGGGCPDLLVGRRGRDYLIEVKSSRGRVSNEQSSWTREWLGYTPRVVRTVDDVFKFASIRE